MQMKMTGFKPNQRGALLLAVGVAAVLSACGGNTPELQSGPAAGAQVAPPPGVGATVTTLALDPAALPDAAADAVVQPMFHAAPALLAAPDDADTLSNDASARHAPHTERMAPEFEGISTRRLTLQAMQASPQLLATMSRQGVDDETASPMAASSVIATYSPAQIRAAYGLPALPAIGANLSAEQAAKLGAGQTIYIVDAMHDPSIVAELAAFNQKFGLPACVTKPIAVDASLPLAPAAAGACEFSVVYNTANSTMTSVAPGYNAGWATEITLDVQWAHATAPLARIVLIESPDASVNSLLGAIKLANLMGPGVVSMSFGANESTWTGSVDAAFGAPNMTYLAATGDSGAAVSWPAVSSKVVAVGGTTLRYSGSGSRSEVAWSGTGGGVSLYTPTPAYQTNAVPGMGTALRRTVADVAFNADPASGQYVAVLAPGAGAVGWLSVGGTSLSTPQWAGLIAVANATRALSAKPALGAPHAVLYGQIGAVPGNYASVFADITSGSDGSCATCTAKVGYDHLSGLGTPNVTSLLSALSGASTVAAAPVLTPAGIGGKIGTPLSFTVAVVATNPVAYSLSGAPAGMTIGAAGLVTWASPVVGTYPVTVVAKDGTTGLSGQAVYTITIAALPAPVVGTAAISGKAGAALSFTVSVVAVNPVAYSLSGAPAGMTISATGIVNWATPVSGTYPVLVNAKDSKTGLTGQGLYTVAIAAPLPPALGALTVNGKPGVALTFTVAAVAPNPVTYSLSGAPAGMSVGATGLVSWANPALGSYAVTVVAKDSKTGLSGQAVATVKIAMAGPVITAAAMTGVAGRSLSGTIGLAAPGASSLSVSISGAPAGMAFSVSGMTITATWPSPVAGNYGLKVTALDSAGLKAELTVPITVNAR